MRMLDAAGFKVAQMFGQPQKAVQWRERFEKSLCQPMSILIASSLDQLEPYVLFFCFPSLDERMDVYSLLEMAL